MKKFQKLLKNKNTVTILGVLACLVILYIGYTSRINSKTKLVTIYYANQTKNTAFSALNFFVSIEFQIIQ